MCGVFKGKNRSFRRILGIPGLALILAIPLYSQENQGEHVFAPFVSRIEAEVRNNFVRLTWKDAEDIRGPVFVYRSESPFSSLSSASLPVPAEIPYGTASFLDEADKAGTFHYLVTASDEWGRKYTLSIPWTNTISVTLSPEQIPEYSRTAPPVKAAPLAAAPLTGFRAAAEGDRVIITFSGADPAKNLILYRSTSPIKRREDLLSALIIKQELSSPHIDYPVPGIPYYYAAVYEEDLAGGLAVLRPGQNASVAAAETEGASRTGIRAMPLPRMNVSSDPAPAALSPAADRAASSLGRRILSGGKTEAEVFPEDLEKNASGEIFQLRSIVQGPFCHYQWQKASEELRRFLSLPREEHNRGRARFYLGQSYYFLEHYREALFEFLSSQEQYPVETKPWIDAVLLKLSGPSGR